MIDFMSQAAFHELLESEQGLHLSMYMQLERETDKLRNNDIRLKNLLREARQQLEQVEHLPTDAAISTPQDLLNPVRELLNYGDFTAGDSIGLAIFLNLKQTRIYRLPLPFPEMVVAGPRFYITPLLPLFDEDSRFHLLALSQNNVRLWRGSRYDLEPLNIPGMPDGIGEALALEDPEGRGLQLHTSTRPAAERPAIFHGHDANKEKKGAIIRYFREINKVVADELGNSHYPLLLAAVAYLWPLYREVNTYPHLLEEGVPGNPEAMDVQELHQQAWRVVQSPLQEERHGAVAQLQELTGTENSSSSIEEIVPAAAYGRVDTLFVPIGVRQWGHFAAESGMVERCAADDAGGEELINLAAAETLRRNGTIFAMQPEEMPGEADIAAIFRYSAT